MTHLGDALIEVLNPSIINYAILGNTDRALHAHLHPRYDTELPEHRKTTPIIYHWLDMPRVPFDVERDAELMAALRAALAKRAACV